MHITDEMHRFAINRAATPPTSPPTRFLASSHDPTSFPDPTPPPHPQPRNLTLGSRSSTLSLNAAYQSPMVYPAPIEPPPLKILPAVGIEPGVYEIKSHVWGSVVDNNAADKKSVIAFSYHGQANQQWEFTLLGKGWSIRSVATGLFLTVERGAGSSVPLVASEFPVAWDVQVVNHNTGLVQIFWPHSDATWDMQDGRSGAPIQLSNRHPQDLQDHKLWRLLPVAKITQSPESESMMPEPDIPHRDRKRHHHNNRSHDHHFGHGRGRGHGFGHGHGHGGHSSSDSSTDSDSDASYTIVKTITKTKTMSKSKAKNLKVKGKAK